MKEFQFMVDCQLCNSSYQMGRHKYEGKHIAKYQLDVCGSCYKANWDGWAPVYEPVILRHLEQKGLPIPDRNSKGWLPRD